MGARPFFIRMDDSRESDTSYSTARLLADSRSIGKKLVEECAQDREPSNQFGAPGLANGVSGLGSRTLMKFSGVRGGIPPRVAAPQGRIESRAQRSDGLGLFGCFGVVFSRR